MQALIGFDISKHRAYLELEPRYTFGLETDKAALEDLVCCTAISNALLPPTKFGCEVFM